MKLSMSKATETWLNTGEVVTMTSYDQTDDLYPADPHAQAKTDAFFAMLKKEQPAEFERLVGFFRAQWKAYLIPAWVNPGKPIRRK